MDDTPRVKLKRLKIDRYRTIKPGTELHFSDGINVLLGKNGTGKTTLLNLLAMVVRGNFHEVREEELAVEFDFSDVAHPGIWSIWVANQKVDGERRPPRRNTEGRTPPLLKTHCEITYRANGGPGPQNYVMSMGEDGIFVITEFEKQERYIGLALSDFGPFNEWNLNFINLIIKEIPKEPINASWLDLLFSEEVNRLDEARDWLKYIFDDELVFISFRQREPHLDGYRCAVPGDLNKALTDLYSKNNQSISLVAESSSILSFERIVAALGYAKGYVAVEQMGSNKERTSFGSPKFHFTKHDGTTVRLEQLSFGEQRLFAFYYYLACTADVVIADELTNGLHHEMISGCIAAMGGRQAFLATQNPLLLDHLEFTSVEQVRAAFILCSKETGDGQQWMAMRQMGADEGGEFFGHYQVEQKQVNAILRWLGLW